MDTPEQQATHDRSEIKVKLCENGLMVKAGEGWLVFEGAEGNPVAGWIKASEHIRARLLALQQKRQREGV